SSSVIVPLLRGVTGHISEPRSQSPPLILVVEISESRDADSVFGKRRKHLRHAENQRYVPENRVLCSSVIKAVLEIARVDFRQNED
ncbi:hypothetical protein K0M31_001109, partial [Melipona bicolor]